MKKKKEPKRKDGSGGKAERVEIGSEKQIEKWKENEKIEDGYREGKQREWENNGKGGTQKRRKEREVGRTKERNEVGRE